MKKIVKFVSIATLIGIITFCSWTLVWFYNLDAPGLNGGEKRAETIISALEKYKDERGNYPTRLSALVPNYLSSIPKPGLRYEYCYELRDDKTYTLAFVPKGEAIGDGWAVYWSKYHDWVRTDSEFCCDCHFHDYYHEQTDE